MASRADIASRRRAVRKGRERGCSLYIPAEQLERAGIDPHGPPPFYRSWDGRKGTVLIQFYKEA